MRTIAILTIGALLAACAGGGMEEAEPVIDVADPTLFEAESVIEWATEPTAEQRALYERMFEEPIDWEAEPASDAVFEKATYIIPNGFGIAGGGVRCNSTSFPGGECKIPKSKRYCLKQLSNTEDPPSGQGFYNTGRASGITRAIALLNTKGYTASSTDPICILTPNVTIRFGNLGTNIMGKMTPTVSSSDVFTIPQGTVKPWSSAATFLDPSEIGAFPGFSNKSTAQKEQFVENITMHELMHAAGLAHNGILDTLLEASPVLPPPITSNFLNDLNPLADEQGFLSTFSVSN
jgi:hypothetical protein